MKNTTPKTPRLKRTGRGGANPPEATSGPDANHAKVGTQAAGTDPAGTNAPKPPTVESYITGRMVEIYSGKRSPADSFFSPTEDWEARGYPLVALLDKPEHGRILEMHSLVYELREMSAHLPRPRNLGQMAEYKTRTERMEIYISIIQSLLAVEISALFPMTIDKATVIGCDNGVYLAERRGDETLEHILREGSPLRSLFGDGWTRLGLAQEG